MNRLRANCYALCLLLLLLIIGGLTNQPVMAKSGVDTILPRVEPGQPPLPPPEITEDSLKLDAKYSELRGNSNSTYEFEVNVNYLGKTAREFQLSAPAPEGFLTYVYPPTAAQGYEPGEIGGLSLEAYRTYPQIIKVWARPLFFNYPEKFPSPGEHVITLTVSSYDGELKASLDLKIIIIGKYEMQVKTGGALEGRLNIQATAGKDNHFPLVITNTGTVPLEKVSFSSEKPEGWSITFEPNDIDSISPGSSHEVDVNMKPSGDTVAADYQINVKVDTKDSVTSSELVFRVTVLKPTVWGWVGIGIILVVAAGLTVIFRRLGRR